MVVGMEGAPQAKTPDRGLNAEQKIKAVKDILMMKSSILASLEEEGKSYIKPDPKRTRGKQDLLQLIEEYQKLRLPGIADRMLELAEELFPGLLQKMSEYQGTKQPETPEPVEFPQETYPSYPGGVAHTQEFGTRAEDGEDPISTEVSAMFLPKGEVLEADAVDAGLRTDTVESFELEEVSPDQGELNPETIEKREQIKEVMQAINEVIADPDKEWLVDFTADQVTRGFTARSRDLRTKYRAYDFVPIIQQMRDKTLPTKQRFSHEEMNLINEYFHKKVAEKRAESGPQS